MGFKIVTVSILFIFSLLSGISFAQNKVVVIPLNDSLSDGELRAICRGYDFACEKPPNKYKCPPKLVFVTASSDYTGNLGGVEGADAKCMQQASLSEITRGKMFKAWISDASNCPANSFIRSQTPYVRTCDRYVIATDWTDLVDGSSLLFIPSCDQYGGRCCPTPHHKVCILVVHGTGMVHPSVTTRTVGNGRRNTHTGLGGWVPSNGLVGVFNVGPRPGRQPAINTRDCCVSSNNYRVSMGPKG